MTAALLLPFGIQAFAIIYDELVFHRRRGLPLWEQLGHPVDTLTQILCFLFPLLLSPTQQHLIFFAAFGAFSCLLVTKDEHVHAELCDWREHWLHSVLYLVHPVVLLAVAFFWIHAQDYPWFYAVVKIQLGLMTAFMTYQIVYWRLYGAARNQ